MKLKKKKKNFFFFFLIFFFFFFKKKSPESVPKFSGRSGNRKHSYFFFVPNASIMFNVNWMSGVGAGGHDLEQGCSCVELYWTLYQFSFIVYPSRSSSIHDQNISGYICTLFILIIMLCSCLGNFLL